MRAMLSLSVSWTALLVAASASAQTAQPALNPPALSSPPTQLAPDAQPSTVPASVQEVVVTATRRSVDLQKVSGTVEALPAATLKSLDITSVLQLPDLVPGLNVLPSGGNNIYLRGIGSASTGYNEEQVATYIDGVYLANPATGIFSFNNVDQIEVLKGPQGTLYGRNATAGLISVTTRDPDVRQRLDATVGVGNYDTTQENVYASTPITDTLGVNVSVFHQEQNRGWGTNVYTGDRIDKGDETGVESKALWKPTSTTKVTGSFIFDTNNRNIGYGYQVAPGTRANDGTPYLGRYNVADDINPSSPFTSYLASLKVQQDFGLFNAQSVSAYQTSHELTLFPGSAPDPGAPIVAMIPVQPGVAKATTINEGVTVDDFRENNRTWTEELQFTSKPSSSPLDWVGGFYFFHNIVEEQLSTIPICGTGALALTCTSGTPITTTGYPTDTSYSGYADATYRIFDATHLTGGLRYTSESIGLTGQVTPFPGRPDSVASLPSTTVTYPGQPFAGFPNGIPTTEHFDKLTFRGVAAQDFGRDIHAYFSFNRGFKSGTFNADLFTNPPAQPEVLDAYEGGIKTELFDRRVRFNAAYFYYDYTNVQVRSTLGAPAGNSFLENVGSEHVKGVDADFTWVATRDLTFNGSAEFLDAKYDQYPGTSKSAYETVSSRTGQMLGLVVNTPANLAGLDVAQAPPITFSVGATYKKETPYGVFALTGNEHYNNRYALVPDNAIHAGAYNLVDAALLWTAPNKHYDVQLYVRNLLNQYTIINALESTSYEVTPGAPRIFGLTLGVHY